MPSTSARNDYTTGLELVERAGNVVMTRTFSKLFGLAALRLGWLYAPPDVIDVLNRVRGPFNVSAPAQVAGIAALEDLEHQERARAHNDRWLPWLARAAGRPRPDACTRASPTSSWSSSRRRWRSAPAAQRLARAPRHPRAADGGLRPAALPAHLDRARGREPGAWSHACGEFVGVSAPGPAPRFERVALIGIGLINGSLALNLRRARAGRRDRRLRAARGDARDGASELGLADRTTTDPAGRGRGRRPRRDRHAARLPSARSPRRWRPASTPDAIVTDVSSIKAQVVRDVRRHLPQPARFVAGHPVAGTEHSGPDAAFAELFRGRHCILTPLEDTDPEAVAEVAALWRAVGMLVETMTPEHHDRVLAITSHLPHLIAYTIVGTVADLEEHLQTEVLRYAAGGFTDFTRIAGSDPVMWRDVFLNNREAVLEMLGRFTEDLAALQRAIRWGEGDKLQELFTRTRAIRRGVIAEGQAYDRRVLTAREPGAAGEEADEGGDS